MRKFQILFSIIIVAVAIFNGHNSIVLAADLCGGTGGNGEIVSVENNEFMLRRNDDGSNQIIHLTNRATIKTSTGLTSVADLKTGDRVTLVGGPNRDGSFTADTVVVCSGTQENGTEQSTSLPIRKENTDYKKVSSIIKILTILLFGLIWFSVAVFFKLKKKKDFVYLLFFTIFYVYLYKVLDYTLIQFQSLLLLKHFLPSLLLRGVQTGRVVNLIPLITLTLEDVKTSLLNILLFLPFGFGLPFVTYFRFKKVVIVGSLLSISIELLQLITGFITNTTFRIADINDLIFNTLGAVIGYILFVGFMRIYHHIFCNWKKLVNPIWQYIAKRPQIDK